MMTATKHLTRAQRVELARVKGLSKRLFPMLLILIRAYINRWDGKGDDGAIAFARETDRPAAMEDLCSRLDAAEPEAFEATIFAWAKIHRARWVDRA